MAAAGATAGSTTARGTAVAAAAIIAAVEAALEKALEAAVASLVQVPAALAAIGAANVVSIAIAGISTGRVALPIAVIQFAAATTLVDFAAELRSTDHLFMDMFFQSTAMVATAAAVVATATTARAAGIATTAIAAAAPKETINQPRFAMTAMTTAIGDEEQTADNGQTSKHVREHGELPPGNLERQNRWKRLHALARSNRSQPKANWSNKRAARSSDRAAP